MVLPPRGVVYGVASRRVLDTVRAVVPVLEQLSFDEAFGEPAELVGAVAQDVERFCEDLRAKVRSETGLVASVGAGSGKQIAKIASGLAKPDGIRVVRRDEERPLLAGLPVRRLWGIGPVAEEQAAPARHRHRRCARGADGHRGRRHARARRSVRRCTGSPRASTTGRSPRRAEAKQISAESTFAEDLTTLDQLRDAIGPIGEHAHRRLDATAGARARSPSN